MSAGEIYVLKKGEIVLGVYSDFEIARLQISKLQAFISPGSYLTIHPMILNEELYSELVKKRLRIENVST